MNLRPLLEGRPAPRRDSLYWYMPLYDPQWGATPAAVIRQGDYKLIELFGDSIDPEHDFDYRAGGRLELYNLRADLGERTNLAARALERGR